MKGFIMKLRLSAPKKVVWFIALVLGLLGVIFVFIHVKYLSDYTYWMVVIAWVLMMLATLIKGL
jgi:hypothetical protein